VDSGTGNTDGRGYSVGATVGNWFQLFGTARPSPAIPTKAPPASGGGYALFLNTAGTVDYRKEWDNGFTDTAGSIFGTEKVSYTALSAQANLVAVLPSSGFAWLPFVGVNVNRQFGFNHTFDIPAQAGTPADTLFIDQSNTFWGVQTGVNIINRGGVRAGLSASYTASADTNIVGGSVFLKIPFDYGVATGGASGIRMAKQ
jgi:hypothetical protein